MFPGKCAVVRRHGKDLKNEGWEGFNGCVLSAVANVCMTFVPAVRVNWTSGMKARANQQKGLTLTELLCVLAIIAILSALYLPAIARAFLRVKRFLSGQ